MRKIKDPINFSTKFGIKKTEITRVGVIDVILNADTRLFIDPLLLKNSRHDEMSGSANSRYRFHFEQVIKLLKLSQNKKDVPWRNVNKLFQFHEISWTCLGYGGSVRGSGFGKKLIAITLKTAKEIVDLGVDDIDLFMVLALFEEGIGADRISDMTTNIILPDLISFNNKVINAFGLKPENFTIHGKDYPLLPNPYSVGNPLILVPDDIVRDLPIATDWSGISRVVNTNANLREGVNNEVGKIWASMSQKDKKRLKSKVLKNKEAFETLLEVIHQFPCVPYDIVSDPNGEVFWGDWVTRASNEFPFDLSAYKDIVLDKNTVFKLVGEIIEQFKFLIEKRDLWRELWNDELKKNRNEKAAQRLFFAVADSYCKSNGLDLTPEAGTGNGPVDFKISMGGNSKVLVEIKLSTNTRIVHGYLKQLEIYREAERTGAAYYLVINVGKMGDKHQKLIKMRNQQNAEGFSASEIVFIDGKPRASASKRK